MFMTRNLNVTPKTTEQCIFVLLKLTTDRHEASRGLFATAELLVYLLVPPLLCTCVSQLSQWSLDLKNSQTATLEDLHFPRELVRRRHNDRCWLLLGSNRCTGVTVVISINPPQQHRTHASTNYIAYWRTGSHGLHGHLKLSQTNTQHR